MVFVVFVWYKEHKHTQSERERDGWGTETLKLSGLKPCLHQTFLMWLWENHLICFYIFLKLKDDEIIVSTVWSCDEDQLTLSMSIFQLSSRSMASGQASTSVDTSPSCFASELPVEFEKKWICSHSTSNLATKISGLGIQTCRRKTQGASSILCTEKQFCGVFSNREISKKVRIVNIFGNTMTRDVWLPDPNILNTKIINVQNILGFLMEMCQGSC